jgi:hypothetical protein
VFLEVLVTLTVTLTILGMHRQHQQQNLQMHRQHQQHHGDGILSIPSIGANSVSPSEMQATRTQAALQLYVHTTLLMQAAVGLAGCHAPRRWALTVGQV